MWTDGEAAAQEGQSRQVNWSAKCRLAAKGSAEASAHRRQASERRVGLNSAVSTPLRCRAARLQALVLKFAGQRSTQRCIEYPIGKSLTHAER
eukprot:6193731-Pleurochrysis_carterae.AAC.2